MNYGWLSFEVVCLDARSCEIKGRSIDRALNAEQSEYCVTHIVVTGMTLFG